jgi:hypothetical protein
MSLTDAEQIFGSIHEDALNDMIRAFLTARPRYRRYGSSAFVAATTVSATHMDAIPFPGIAGGIDWRVSFDIPVIDLFKQTKPLPPQLTLGPKEFSLHTQVEICLNCVKRRDDHQGTPGKDNNDRQNHLDQVVCTSLEAFGVGHLDSSNQSNGDRVVRLRVDAVELVDITPDSLETILECLIKMVLDAALSQMQLPVSALIARAFPLPLLVLGPDIDDDRIKVFANL